MEILSRFFCALTFGRVALLTALLAAAGCFNTATEEADRALTGASTSAERCDQSYPVYLTILALKRANCNEQAVCVAGATGETLDCGAPMSAERAAFCERTVSDAFPQDITLINWIGGQCQ